MAAITADSVVIEIIAKIDRFDPAIDRSVGKFEAGMGRIERAGRSAEAAATRVGSSFNALGSVLSGFAGGLAGGLIATLTTQLPSALISAAKNAVDYAGALGEASDQLGVTTDFLQKFRFAATQSGASMEAADTSLAKFSRTVGDAANGVKVAVNSFTALGVSVADAQGNLKSTDQLFSEVADAIAKIPDPARQSAAAFDIFGKGASAILPLLKSGAAGFSELGDAAQRLGLVLTPDTIKKLDDLADKGDAIRQVITSQVAAAIGENAEAILSLGRAASASIGALGTFLTRYRGLQEAIARRGTFGASILGGGSAELNEQLATRKGRIEYDRADVASLEKRVAAQRADLSNPRATSGVAYEQFVKPLEEKLNAARARLRAGVDEELNSILPDPLKPKAAPGGIVTPPKSKSTTTRSAAAAKAPKIDPFSASPADVRAGKASYDLETEADPNNAFSIGQDIEAAKEEAAQLAVNLQKGVDALVAGSPTAGLLEESIGRAADIAADFTRDLSYGLADAVLSGKSLGDVLVDSLKRAAVEALAGGLFKLFGSFLGGGGGGGGGILGALFGGKRANGGPVTGATPYLVGERGPELFVPNANGNIRPAGSFSGGQSVVINQPLHLHFDVGLESVDQRISRAAPVLLSAAQRGTIDALRNTGIGRV